MRKSTSLEKTLFNITLVFISVENIFSQFKRGEESVSKRAKFDEGLIKKIIRKSAAPP